MSLTQFFPLELVDVDFMNATEQFFASIEPSHLGAFKCFKAHIAEPKKFFTLGALNFHRARHQLESLYVSTLCKVSLEFFTQIFDRRTTIDGEAFEVEILPSYLLHKTESLLAKLSSPIALLEGFHESEAAFELAVVSECRLGVFRLFKTHKAESVGSFIYLAAGDRSKNFESLFQIFVTQIVGWEVLDEEVGADVFRLRSFSHRDED